MPHGNLPSTFKEPNKLYKLVCLVHLLTIIELEVELIADFALSRGGRMDAHMTCTFTFISIGKY